MESALKESTFKRLFAAIFVAGFLMILDVLALIAVTRAFLPRKPPMWATAPFFWVLAWPVQIFTWIEPPAYALRTGGPPLPTVVLGAIVDLALLAFLVDWIRRRRATGA